MDWKVEVVSLQGPEKTMGTGLDALGTCDAHRGPSHSRVQILELQLEVASFWCLEKIRARVASHLRHPHG